MPHKPISPFTATFKTEIKPDGTVEILTTWICCRCNQHLNYPIFDTGGQLLTFQFEIFPRFCCPLQMPNLPTWLQWSYAPVVLHNQVFNALPKRWRNKNKFSYFTCSPGYLNGPIVQSHPPVVHVPVNHYDTDIIKGAVWNLILGFHIRLVHPSRRLWSGVKH